MLKQASTNTNQLWTKIRAKLGIIDYKPHAFENSICHILSKRISFEAKIEPDDIIDKRSNVIRCGLYVKVTKEQEKN